MAVPSQDVRIDLDNDGLFESGDEVTSAIRGSRGQRLMRSVRGRDAARLLSPSRAGELSFSLDNAGGDYNPGTGITIGQGCRWQATDPATSIVHPLFRGLLDEPEQVPQSGLQNRVNVRVLGLLSTLVGRQVSTELYQDIDTGTAIDHLLDELRFGMIAAGTTNYVANPRAAGSFLSYGPPTWNHFVNGTVTATYTQTSDGEGGYYVDVRIQNPGVTTGQYNSHWMRTGYRMAAEQGDKVSISVGIALIDGALPSGATLAISLNEFNGASYVTTTPTGRGTVSGLTDEVQRFEATQTVSNASTTEVDGSLLVSPNITPGADFTLRLHFPQVEAGDVVTPPCAGDLDGPGYSWSGTPHASASERAAGEARDLTKRKIDTGRTELEWWPTSEITDAKRELDRLVASEGPGAGLYEDGSGALVFKSRHAILLEERSNTSNATLSTAYTASEPRLSSPWTYDPGNRDRIQRCHVNVVRREAQTLGEVWALGTTVVLGANEIRSYSARAERGDPITNAQVPTTADGDYTVSAGSLTSITLERTSGLFVRINLRAGSDGATITGLRLRGQRVAVVSETVISDQIGIEGDNLPSYPLEVHPEIDPDDAQQFCDAVVGFYRNGRPRLTVTLEGIAAAERLTQALAREIHDRVRVVDANTGIDIEGYVHTIRHEVYSPGRMVTTFEVEEAVSENFAVWDGDESLWDVALWGW